jgi:hypothetical protein
MLLSILLFHFKVVVDFHAENLKREWQAVKHHANHFCANHTPQELWASLIKHRRHAYPNVCSLAVSTCYQYEHCSSGEWILSPQSPIVKAEEKNDPFYNGNIIIAESK